MWSSSRFGSQRGESLDVRSHLRATRAAIFARASTDDEHGDLRTTDALERSNVPRRHRAVWRAPAEKCPSDVERDVRRLRDPLEATQAPTRSSAAADEGSG